MLEILLFRLQWALSNLVLCAVFIAAMFLVLFAFRGYRAISNKLRRK